MTPEVYVVGIKAILPYLITMFQHVLSPLRVKAVDPVIFCFCRKGKENLTPKIYPIFKMNLPVTLYYGNP